MKHGSLFSGIGGFDLAAEWMGWENIFHCENNSFCQKILKHYWPNAKSYGDIKETDFSEWKGSVDIISGGFPCQPYSTAGKRKGKEDERHLWPEMLRAIREVQPCWVVGENVSGLLNWNGGMVLDEIKADLEAAGFEVLPPLVLPACGKNAPHRRDRLWILAYSNVAWERRQKRGKEIKGNVIITDTYKINGRTGTGRENGQEINNGNERYVTNTNCNKRPEGRMHQTKQQEAERYVSTFNAQSHERITWDNFPTQSPLCGRNDGVSNRVDRIKALGNAVVPQIVFELFKAIQTIENENM